MKPYGNLYQFHVMGDYWRTSHILSNDDDEILYSKNGFVYFISTSGVQCRRINWEFLKTRFNTFVDDIYIIHKDNRVYTGDNILYSMLLNDGYYPMHSIEIYEIIIEKLIGQGYNFMLIDYDVDELSFIEFNYESILKGKHVFKTWEDVIHEKLSSDYYTNIIDLSRPLKT